jgi:chaperone modulatory protein CbpM
MEDETEIAARLQGVTVERLRIWVQLGWVRPVVRDGNTTFADVDIARAALVQDLQEIIGIDENAVPVVLKLIDQIHGLRRELKTLVEAIDRQPDSVRRELQSYRLERYRRLSEGRLDDA